MYKKILKEKDGKQWYLYKMNSNQMNFQETSAIDRQPVRWNLFVSDDLEQLGLERQHIRISDEGLIPLKTVKMKFFFRIQSKF